MRAAARAERQPRPPPHRALAARAAARPLHLRADCSSLKNIEAIQDAPNYTFVKGSITTADLVNYVLRTERIDTIMHFAAQTHVDNSFGNSLAFTLNNTYGEF